MQLTCQYATYLLRQTSQQKTQNLRRDLIFVEQREELKA